MDVDGVGVAIGVIVGIGDIVGSGRGVGIGVSAGIGVVIGLGVTCAMGTPCERAIPNVVPSASNAKRRIFIIVLYPQAAYMKPADRLDPRASLDFNA